MDPDNVLGRARNLREVLDACGIDPEDPLAVTLRQLAAVARWDLVAKLVRPLLGEATKRVVEGRAFGLLRGGGGGGIVLGTATDLGDDGDEISLPVEAFRLHAGISGQSGTGKSYLAKWIAQQLIERGLRVTVYDAEDEYRCLLPLFPRDQLLWLRPSWLKINPFEPNPGEELRAWTGQIGNLLRSVYFLREGAVSLFSSVLGELYVQRGCFRGSEQWPSLAHVLAKLHLLKFAQTSKSSAWLESLYRCVTTLLDRLGGTLNVVRGIPFAELDQRSVILDVSDLDSPEAEFLITLLLMRSSGAGDPQPLRVVVLEEAHRLLNPFRQRREDLGEPPLQEALRRIRKRNVGVVLCDQAPGLLPHSVLANLGTRVCFAMPNQRDVRTVGSAMGLDDEQLACVPLLPPRVAVVQSRFLPRAGLVRVPELAFPEPPSHAEIEREMRPVLAGWAHGGPEDERSVLVGRGPDAGSANGGWTKGVTGARQAEPQPRGPKAGESGDSAGAANDPAVHVMLPGRGVLSLEALKYLEAWNEEEHHFLPLTVLDKRLGISLAKGNHLREQLKAAGLIEIRLIKTGARGAPVRTVRILGQGFARLKEAGVTPRPYRGKGSFEAAFWAAQIARSLVHTMPGAKPVIEDARTGKAVDVAVEIEGRWRAYEVSLSPGWVSQNVVKDALTGYDEIVVAALTEEAIRAIKERLEKELGPGEEAAGLLQCVRFQLLRDFLAWS